MSANTSDQPYTQGVEEGYGGQRPLQEARSVLYIHGSLDWSELFRTLPCR